METDKRTKLKHKFERASSFKNVEQDDDNCRVAGREKAPPIDIRSFRSMAAHMRLEHFACESSSKMILYRRMEMTVERLVCLVCAY